MKLIKKEDLKDIIKDGDSVATCGFTSAMLCDHAFRGIEESFLECGHPRDLEIVSVPFIGTRTPGEGMDRLAHKGLLRGARTTHINLCPNVQKAVMNNEIYCMMYPFGCIVQLYRDMGSGKPGIISKVGLGTFIDPRIEGGRCNEKTTENVCEVMEIAGEEYLFYPKFDLDVAIIRGTSADEKGNITLEDEAVLQENMEIAQAVKSNGGTVIVQVKNIVPAGSMKPREVIIPGIMVDYVLVAPPEHHMQTMVTYMNPDWTHRARTENVRMPEAPMDERKIIARRAAMEIPSGAVINLGIGVPEMVGAVAAEEGFSEDITMTVECGHVGGIPAGGFDFGGCYNPDYVTNSVRQMDFYDGGGLDVCVLSAAEVDRFGNTNVTKFGRIVGPGGYINIATGAKEAVFCGSMTAGGLEIKAGDGKLKIISEGKKKKFVSDVEQITYSGRNAAQRGQKVTYITERAVFRLVAGDGDSSELGAESGAEGKSSSASAAGGAQVSGGAQEADGAAKDSKPTNGPALELIEIAPGIDLEKDVLDQIEFEVAVSPDLKLMDERIFTDGPMGLTIK